MPAKMLKNLRVPKDNGLVFVRPELSKWKTLSKQNSSAVSAIALRSEARTELLDIASSYTARISNSCDTNNLSGNIVVTGHQAGWHHCGVWAKVLMADMFARTSQGCCVFLVLDHDICRTDLIIPSSDTSEVSVGKNIPIEVKKMAVPLEYRSSNGQICDFILSVARDRPGQYCSAIWTKHMKHIKKEVLGLSHISDVIMYLQAMLNRAFGLDRILYLPVSLLSQSTAFVNFVSHILADAHNFACAYNRSISHQIETENIRPSETLRPLEIGDDSSRIELPFWLISPYGKRQPLYVNIKSYRECKLLAGSNELGPIDLKTKSKIADQLRAVIKFTKYRLRPKAVPLTLFSRLYLADWFIHGVGGAYYEAITDRLIEDYSGIKNLSFGVATATMTFPLDSQLIGNDNIEMFRRQLRIIKHSPEKFLPAELSENSRIISLVTRKNDLITESRDLTMTSDQRHLAWKSIDEVNGHLRKMVTSKSRELERKLKTAEEFEAARHYCGSREHFFGLFNENALRNLSGGISFKEFGSSEY